MKDKQQHWRPGATFTTLERRAEMLQSARQYFSATRALEVETPTLSRYPVSDVHLASVQANLCGNTAWLHTSPEYAMKRLLAAGCGDIYQIGRVYRDNEQGRYHNPEFTMIEWYRLNYDHHQLIEDVEALIGCMLPSRCLDRAERISYEEAIMTHAQVNPFDDGNETLISALTRDGVDVPKSIKQDRDALLDLIMSTVVGPKLGMTNLIFVYDYPASQASLARIRGKVASRFEAYLDGLEIANGFHELSDANEQRARFDADNAQRTQRGLPVNVVDEFFLTALAEGLPDCSGVALGFERLVMCAVGAKHIDEVLAFSHQRV
ncbi:MAG TPA: elongation factor P--(R)-beta-lysine ligase [Steroidobacteraceae bacterium]|nr:elongation factor P--(R)-beta-lysine ligase [Steroidobacteraceae bacterium]